MTIETAASTETNALMESQADAERKRKLALLKAVGLDRVPVEQRELALAIAKRYDLDLLLKHLVLIDGKPYITRDALLWIAHRSGQFDGIAVTRPVIEGDYWYAEATVYRKDMGHPFVYGGRYPVKGGNVKFAPEMAVKVAESMSLRRAFNVSAPSADERWDVDVPAAEPEPPKSLAEKVAEKAAAVQVLERTDDGFTAVIEPAPGQRTVDLETGEIAEVDGFIVASGEAMKEVIAERLYPKDVTPTKATGTTPPTSVEPTALSATSAPAGEQCASVSKLSGEQCRREAGHGDLHRTTNEAWHEADAA